MCRQVHAVLQSDRNHRHAIRKCGAWILGSSDVHCTCIQPDIRNSNGFACNAGHYITYTRISNQWILYDDACISKVSEEEVQRCFGDASRLWNNDMHAYLLFYELVGGQGARSPESGVQSIGRA